jgi:hypothetical protein
VDDPGDVGVDPSHETDAELLARLRARRNPLPAFLGLLWAALAAGQLGQGNRWLAAAYAALVLGCAWKWWVSPSPHVSGLTADVLSVRRGLRTQELAAADVLDVQPRSDTGSAYGLLLTLRDADPVLLPGTAARFSVAAEQAGALRRWARPAG